MRAAALLLAGAKSTCRLAGRLGLMGLAAAASLALSACQDEAPAALPETFVHEPGDRITTPPSQAATLHAGGAVRPILSVLNVPQPLSYGEFVWNDKDVPPGKTWVLVDLKAQTMSVFRGAHEIGTAVTLYGVDKKPTPTGRFTVLAKLKDHQSSIYDAEMPYTLRLTNDGIAIHGSDVRSGVGTHGCLGIPLEFARLVFDRLRHGDEVLVLPDAAAQMLSPTVTQPTNA